MRRFLKGLLVWLFTFSIGKGLLIWLEEKGVRPDVWVASGIGYAEAALVDSAIQWILAGIIGFIGLALWHYFPTQSLRWSFRSGRQTGALANAALENPLAGGKVENGWRIHEFDLCADKGSKLSLGTPSGPDFVYFELLGLVSIKGVTCLRFVLGGSGLGISDGSNSPDRQGLIFEADNSVRMLGDGNVTADMSRLVFVGEMAANKGAALEVNGRINHVRIQVSSTDIRSLRLIVAVRPGTFSFP
jgi:hypothetical protein